MKPSLSTPSRQRALLWVAVAVALTTVFAAYLNPHLAVELANQVWSCF